MKRTPLKRTVALKRSRANSYRLQPKDVDPARALWKTPRYGRCQNCGLLDDMPLHGAHILERQTLARMGFPEFDPANRMNLCADCHMSSHNGFWRIGRFRWSECGGGSGVHGADVGLGRRGGYARRHYLGSAVQIARALRGAT